VVPRSPGPSFHWPLPWTLPGPASPPGLGPAPLLLALASAASAELLLRAIRSW
jgi:hypothetical protein